jgi:hypothetical protein
MQDVERELPVVVAGRVHAHLERDRPVGVLPREDLDDALIGDLDIGRLEIAVERATSWIADRWA